MKFWKNGFYKILVVVLLLVIIFGLTKYFYLNRPKETPKQITQYIIDYVQKDNPTDQDKEKIKSYYKQEVFDKFSKETDTSDSSGNSDVVVTIKNIDESKTKATVTIEFQVSIIQVPIQFKFVKEGNYFKGYKWLIEDVIGADSNTSSSATSKKNTKIVEKKVGEEFELATIKVKVNGIEEKQTINAPYSEPLVAKENTRFVLVDIDITNITKDSIVFNTEGINLVDNQERNFGTYKDEYVSLDSNLEYKDLSPNITQKGVLVYELPNDATNYALEINKAGTDELYKVILK